MDTKFPPPAGRAKLYLRQAHETPAESLRERNDEVLERINSDRRHFMTLQEHDIDLY